MDGAISATVLVSNSFIAPQLACSRQCDVPKVGLDWIEQCFTSPPTQYRLYGRRFLQVKDPTNSIKVLKEQ